jgi:hypothetical protein
MNVLQNEEQKLPYDRSILICYLINEKIYQYVILIMFIREPKTAYAHVKESQDPKE